MISSALSPQPSALSVSHAPTLLLVGFYVYVAEAERHVCVEVEVGALAREEFDCAGGGDHGGVVGRKMTRREIGGDAEARGRPGACFAQRAGSGHAAHRDGRAPAALSR